MTRHKRPSCFRKPGKEDRTGYIVVREDGYYLGHDLRWYPHPSPERAFVHDIEFVTTGLPAETKYLIRAHYHRDGDTTEVLSGCELPNDVKWRLKSKTLMTKVVSSIMP